MKAKTKKQRELEATQKRIERAMRRAVAHMAGRPMVEEWERLAFFAKLERGQ